MATYTFVADSTDQFVDWNTPSVWSGGVVPNSPDAVVIPEIIQLSTGKPYYYQIAIQPSESYVLDSISITDNFLILDGALSIANGFDLLQGSELDILG